MKIKGKLLLNILFSSFILFSLSIGYISYNFRKASLETSERLIEKEAQIYANGFKSSLDVNISLTRTLATFFEDYKMLPMSIRIELFRNVQKNLLIKNPQILSVGTSWENAKFDSVSEGRTGRFLEGYHREMGKIRPVDRQYEEDTTSYYHQSKETKNELIIPFQENYSQRVGDEVAVASIAVPIVVEEEFVGLAGIDVALDEFERQIEKISPLPGSYAFLISNKGQFLAHVDTSVVFKYLEDYFTSEYVSGALRENIGVGRASAVDFTGKDGREYYAFVAPIHLSRIDKPWAIGIAVPIEEVVKEANFNFFFSIIIGVISMMLLSLITWYYSKQVIDPLNDSIETLEAIAKGNISAVDPLEVNSNDEIAQIRSSINALLVALKSTAIFAQQIGQGNFEVEYKLLSKNDVLGNALLEMRENLRLAEEEDNKRVIEELKLNWSTEGVAKFGDILRNEQGDLPVLAYKLISNLVKHLKAAQGGFYYLNPNEDGGKPFVEMLASYALDSDRTDLKNFELGEGVIGEVVRKNEKVYLKNIPNSYLKVVSGLGKANPRELLVVPVSNENGVFGAVELSSFIEFDNFQIEFIEDLCNSIAGTFETSLANARTKRLLRESGLQKEQLEMHEKQLMENIAKLETIQMATADREAELKSILSALHSVMPVAEYDMEGIVIFANQILLDALQMKEVDLLGRRQGSMRSDRSKEDFERFWGDLMNGETKYDEQYFKFEERELWLSEVYTPILGTTGVPYKVLNIATDITARKLLERKLSEQ